MPLIVMKNICKSYGIGKKTVPVLDQVNLTIEEGEMLAITGKSGAGKSTLLNIVGAADRADSGKYFFRDKELKIRKTSDGVRFRRENIGIIVKHFALIDDLSVYDNISMALWENRIGEKEMKRRTDEVLDRLEIASLKSQYPSELSGGEKQRVAIGRAIIKRPALLLADEPTGALDAAAEKMILSILKSLNSEGTSMIIVTQNAEVAAQCSRTFELVKH